MDDENELNPRRRGLGRGLSALFEDDEDDFGVEEAGDEGRGRRPVVVGIDQLEPGSYQPRREMNSESIAELAESIAVHGVLQPLLVRPQRGASGRYEIIAGERRWRAAQQAQLHEVPVTIRDIDDVEALELGLIENLQREDLNPLEEAQGYRQLIEEFGHTQEKVAAGLGKSRSHVANMMRLLNLPPAVQDYIREDRMSMGHARALVTAPHPEELAKKVISQGLSVRQTEKLAAQIREDSYSSEARQKKGKPGKDVDTLALEEEISNVLGMKVSIDSKAGGKGTLKIEFRNLDQLDDVLHRLSHR